jgi:hypothetical protein
MLLLHFSELLLSDLSWRHISGTSSNSWRFTYDVMLSQRLTLIKSSQAISDVSLLKATNISGTISVHIIRTMV